jgi:hypothetical protein
VRLFHTHRWVERERAITPPNPVPGTTLEHPSADLAEKLTRGCTDILLRCEECGELTTRTFYGTFKDGDTP